MDEIGWNFCKTVRFSFHIIVNHFSQRLRILYHANDSHRSCMKRKVKPEVSMRFYHPRKLKMNVFAQCEFTSHIKARVANKQYQFVLEKIKRRIRVIYNAFSGKNNIVKYRDIACRKKESIHAKTQHICPSIKQNMQCNVKMFIHGVFIVLRTLPGYWRFARIRVIFSIFYFASFACMMLLPSAFIVLGYIFSVNQPCEYCNNNNNKICSHRQICSKYLNSAWTLGGQQQMKHSKIIEQKK